MTGMKDTRSKIVATYFCFWLTLKTEVAVSKLVELDLTLPWPGSPFSLDSWGCCITSFKQPEKNKQTNKQTNDQKSTPLGLPKWSVIVQRRGGWGGIKGLWLLWLYTCCDKIYLILLRLCNILVISPPPLPPPPPPCWQLIGSISSIVLLSYSFGDDYFPLWSPRLPHLTPCYG